MAFGRAGCVWTLVLGACVALAMGTDCGNDCALCVYRLLGQQSPLASPFQTCSLECDGGLDSRKLRICRELLLDEESRTPTLDADDEDEVDPEAAAPSDAQAASPEHQLAKKYGGFMKRYGGFMARRSPPASSSSSSSLQGAPEEPGSLGRGEEGQEEEEEEEEEKIRLRILKILNAEAGGRGAGVEAKRYGGFMRRAGFQADPLEAVLGRALKKRYGGFMRRVGRPEWLVDDSSSKDRAGGQKRAWEDGNVAQKRYGGFMD